MSHPVLSYMEDIKPDVDFWSVRIVEDDCEETTVRQDVLEPVKLTKDCGAMVSVIHKGGQGYAGVSDLTSEGVKNAYAKAKYWALSTQGKLNFKTDSSKFPKPDAVYQTPEKIPFDSWSFKDRIDFLREVCAPLKQGEQIVDWNSSLNKTQSKQTFFTSEGGKSEQSFLLLVPNLLAVANQKSNTQIRSLNRGGFCRQGGKEILDAENLKADAVTIGQEAIALLSASNCPSGTMDLLLAPDQMLLQIHETIGHPIELDRILGDERNYAGTSFVTKDMFGSYQYGSELLNVAFDPTLPDEFASYKTDDDGVEAEKALVIEKGILTKPLGGFTSQARAGLSGVANSRASSWNRPPIDRMANLNVLPGNSDFNDMVKNVEKGIFMKTNNSWSIDDSRNKFQFGCEWGQLIENGKLTKVVRNPNYRGISASFWRNLKMVGDKKTFEAYGSPFCGKGEPNQCIRVGHASPACLFSNVDVFGGVS